MSFKMPFDGIDTKPHFVLVPLMAQGHMIPMIDLACLLAGHGATVTLITTPVNTARISTTINRVEQSGLPILFTLLRFPATEVGLPEGLENIDMLPSRNLIKNFFDAICMLKDQLVLHIGHHCHPRPTCIISDNIHYWTQDVAQQFGIPRLVFHGFGCFPLLCIHNIIQSLKIDKKMEDENEPFLVPGLPNCTIEVTRAQLPGFLVMPSMDQHREKLREAELASDGVVVNTFDDLEPGFSEWYGKAIGKKVWTIGPVSLSSRDVVIIASRGNKAAVNENQCLRWLDSKRPSSVLYVSFGSLADTIPAQLVEIGLGLEASNCPFIWAIKVGERLSEMEEWLSEFEERTRDRGLIIRGWAPQMMILTHSSVGGFMTHCGWNSMLESMLAGVPMITWPHFAEQFFNERLVVDVLRIGVAIGVKVPTLWGEDNKSLVLVNKDDVVKAVKRLFIEEKEVEERKKRAKELVEKAKKSVEEGGSSFINTTKLIQHMNASNCMEGMNR